MGQLRGTARMHQVRPLPKLDEYVEESPRVTGATRATIPLNAEKGQRQSLAATVASGVIRRPNSQSPPHYIKINSHRSASRPSTG
jgi:hypothetical protein